VFYLPDQIFECKLRVKEKKMKIKINLLWNGLVLGIFSKSHVPVEEKLYIYTQTDFA
jgi:hypothetical protein